MLSRTPLLLEVARPTVAVLGHSKSRTIHGKRKRYNGATNTKTPKARSRQISGRRKIGATRRGLVDRIVRRLADNARPSAAQILRGRQQIKQKRRASEKPYLQHHISARVRLLKGIRL